MGLHASNLFLGLRKRDFLARGDVAKALLAFGVSIGSLELSVGLLGSFGVLAGFIKLSSDVVELVIKIGVDDSKLSDSLRPLLVLLLRGVELLRQRIDARLSTTQLDLLLCVKLSDLLLLLVDFLLST